MNGHANRRQYPADNQLSERISHLPAGLWFRLNVLARGERDVSVTNAHAQRLPVDLGVCACGDERRADRSAGD